MKYKTKWRVNDVTHESRDMLSGKNDPLGIADGTNLLT